MATTDTSDNLALYAACCDHGSDAQADAYTVLGNELFRIARSMLRSSMEGEALAQDCAQMALVKIHRTIAQCTTPARFREWAYQVVRRVVLDELRRPERRRLASLPDDDDHAPWLASDHLLRSTVDLHALLREVIDNGPMSERSRRVVVGRYFEDRPDDQLAQDESAHAGQTVTPANVQVTRAKDIAALRRDPALVQRLRELADTMQG